MRTKDKNKVVTIVPPNISFKESDISSHSSFWHNMDAEDEKSNESYDFANEEKLRLEEMQKNRDISQSISRRLFDSN